MKPLLYIFAGMVGLGLFLLLLPAIFKLDMAGQNVISGRFQLILKPANCKAPNVAYLLDTATGRLWALGVAREVTQPDGSSVIEYSGWKEETTTKP